MVTRYQKTADPGSPGKENKAAAQQAGASKDACRCKKVSLMPPRKLFGLMLSDLAFWKKAKKGSFRDR